MCQHGQRTADEVYWLVRRKVIFRHTGELPTDIRGPDAEKLLNLVFMRDIGQSKNRALLSISLLSQRRMITDGILMRLEKTDFDMHKQTAIFLLADGTHSGFEC